ncbi:MAG: asparaginase [Chloroflexi bacterium]|nr:asparaginase [Chloroflexota bacterium]MYD47827.1 asparaginase [Chloroflexota bacterium]
MPNPTVHVIATGGSIAGVGPDRMDYIRYPEIGDHLTIEQNLARVPEISDNFNVIAEDMVSVGSTAIGPANWIALAERIHAIDRDEPDTAGIVITHGTATLEETAYFLHLTVKAGKPVVITGAMRPPTSISTDADLNLLNACQIAATPESAGMGVLTVLNNEIHCAREVYKANTLRVETFMPNELGFLGYADSDHRVVFYRRPYRKHTTDTPFRVDGMTDLPRVDIVHAYAGADGMLIDAARAHADRTGQRIGLVVAGFGAGTFPPTFIAAAESAVAGGMPVVLASRSSAGRVVMTPRKDEQGFIVSDNLMPQKARILLMLGLTVTDDRQAIQQMFYEY